MTGTKRHQFDMLAELEHDVGVSTENNRARRLTFEVQGLPESLGFTYVFMILCFVLFCLLEVGGQLSGLLLGFQVYFVLFTRFLFLQRISYHPARFSKYLPPSMTLSIVVPSYYLGQQDVTHLSCFLTQKVEGSVAGSDT